MDATSQNIKPIRILHVVGGMNRGGVETWLMHVLRHIDRDHFRMDFLVHTALPCAYDEEIRSLGSKIIPCLSPSRPWTYARNFTGILREHGPYDVVHSHVHHFSGCVVKLAHRAGVPLRISHSHNDTTDLEARAGMIRQAYLSLMKCWIERHATLGLSCSRKAAIALFGSAWEANPRRQVLYYGIDLLPFRTPPDRVEMLSELGIPQDGFVIGHVGRFAHQKNHDFLIDVFSELIKLQPSSYLVLVGEGELRLEMEKRVAERGLSERVRFLGSRSDVPHLMRTIVSLFVFPSFYEGLGLVLIEAQAAGLPLVVSDGLPEETNVIPALVRRVPLSKSALAWAEEVLAHYHDPAVRSVRDPVGAIERSPFHVLAGVTALEEIYARDAKMHHTIHGAKRQRIVEPGAP